MSRTDIATGYRRFVRYFWDPEPSNDDPSHSSIWCLGQQYSAVRRLSANTSRPGTATSAKDRRSPSLQATTIPDAADSETVILSTDIPSSQRKSEINGEPMTETNTSEEERGWPNDFLDDFESRFWFTYRSHFPPIAKSVDPQAASALSLAVRLRSQLGNEGFTSDTGWGCMIRSGQCVIANAIARVRLGRDWRRGEKLSHEQQILSWFADDPAAPFSIHKFVSHGASACGKHPGEWFGPSATARCIQALSHAHHESGIKVYLTGDGPDVYEESVFALAHEDDPKTFTPVLILAGTRLGIKDVNKVYWESLKKSLQLPQSIGIAGGRPSASHYFIGTQSSSIFYLDPHQTRPALPYHEDPSHYTPEEISSCHTRRLRRLEIADMDPSMLIAFLITSEEDFHAWKQGMQEVQGQCVVHVSLREPNIKGLDEMNLTENESDVEHDAEDEDHHEEGEEVNADAGSEAELIESRKVREEAVDEVEVLDEVPPSPSPPTPPVVVSRNGSGLAEEGDGEIVNMPSSPSPAVLKRD